MKNELEFIPNVCFRKMNAFRMCNSKEFEQSYWSILTDGHHFLIILLLLPV